jgi:hypothetical protein
VLFALKQSAEENSGLAEVIPVNYINETINASQKAKPQ